MKIRSRYISIVSIVVMVGCSGPKPLTTLKDNAFNASTQGNYTLAVENWQKYFSQHSVEEIDADSYASAAQAAFLAGDSDMASKWYDEARYKNYASAEMYFTLAKIYHSQENISKELSALEFYTKNYNENQDEINNRLFEIYYEIEMYDKALVVWDKLNEPFKKQLSNQEKIFEISLKNENTEVSDSLSVTILEKDPKNVDALEWNAKKYYWNAENRYQEQMEKYNEHKTTKQYKILVNELDKVTADFKRALPYFQKLWGINPGKKYASYMANIYARLGDEKKSDFYKKYLN